MDLQITLMKEKNRLNDVFRLFSNRRKLPVAFIMLKWRKIMKKEKRKE